MNVKDFAIFAVKSVDESNGSFEAVLSAPSLDRDGEVIDSGAFNPLPKSIPILLDHNGKVGSLVGSGTPFYDGDVLKVKGTLSSVPDAQRARTLLQEGHLTTMSVGFMPPQTQIKQGTRHIVSSELLEASFVVIPSNRDALVTGAKAFMDIEPVAGSFEDVMEDVREYLSEMYGDNAYVWLLATFNDHCVYQVEHEPSVTTDGCYAITFSNDEPDNDDYTFGQPTPVEISAVVSPKSLNRIIAKAGARNSANDQAAIQTAHDYTVKAGATCAMADGSDDGKSLDQLLISAELNLFTLADDDLSTP